MNPTIEDAFPHHKLGEHTPHSHQSGSLHTKNDTYAHMKKSILLIWAQIQDHKRDIFLLLNFQ